MIKDIGINLMTTHILTDDGLCDLKLMENGLKLQNIEKVELNFMGSMLALTKNNKVIQMTRTGSRELNDIKDIFSSDMVSGYIKTDGTVHVDGMRCNDAFKEMNDWTNMKQVIVSEKYGLGITNDGEIICTEIMKKFIDKCMLYPASSLLYCDDYVIVYDNCGDVHVMTSDSDETITRIDKTVKKVKRLGSEVFILYENDLLKVYNIDNHAVKHYEGVISFEITKSDLVLVDANNTTNQINYNAKICRTRPFDFMADSKNEMIGLYLIDNTLFSFRDNGNTITRDVRSMTSSSLYYTIILESGEVINPYNNDIRTEKDVQAMFYFPNGINYKSIRKVKDEWIYGIDSSLNIPPNENIMNVIDDCNSQSVDIITDKGIYIFNTASGIIAPIYQSANRATQSCQLQFGHVVVFDKKAIIKCENNIICDNMKYHNGYNIIDNCQDIFIYDNDLYCDTGSGPKSITIPGSMNMNIFNYNVSVSGNIMEFVKYANETVVTKPFKEITIEVGQRCGNECVYCSSCSTPSSTHMIPYTKIKQIIDEATDLDFTHVNFSGGEPFLHPQLDAIILYAKSKGLYTTVYSSGVFIEGRTKRDIPLALVNSCFSDKIVFNMQSANEEGYQQVVNSDHSVRNLFNSITKFVDIKKRTEINYVPMSINVDNIEEVVTKCEELNVTQLNILKLVVQGRGTINLVPSDEQMSKFVERIEEIKNNSTLDVRVGGSFDECVCGTTNCKAGKQKVVVRYDGQVLPCERYKFMTNDISIYNYSLEQCIEKMNANR